MEKILTVNDVAEVLQVKAITVRQMFREERLRGFKVGKAWRTTETMLQEDIDALARGESVASLPKPAAPSPAPAPSSLPEAEAPAPKKRRPRKKPEPTAAKSEKSDDTEPDDSQQLLF